MLFPADLRVVRGFGCLISVLEPLSERELGAQCFGRRAQPEIPEALYNLRLDPGEQKSVLKDHRKIVKRLEGLLEEARADLGDSLTGVKPTQARTPGKAD